MDVVSHAEMRELLGAYAVHALEDDEFERVAAHLDGCPECRDEVDDLLDASASLGLSAIEPPSTAMWERIAAEVRAPATTGTAGARPEGVVRPGEHRSAAAERTPPVAAEMTRDRMAPVIALDAAREAKRERRSKWRIGVASAAAAVALAVPITSALSGSSAPSLAALAKTASSSDGARVVSLASADGITLADVVVTKEGKGYLQHSTLPALPAGRTYQLWALAGDKAVSAGVLGPNPDISAFTVNPAISAMAISVEPSDGSAQPTTTPVASAAVAV